jgi:four helix bundle protein
VRLFQALPKGDMAAQVLGKQVLRSGTSVGAQYREANRARSRAEFLSKVEACLQELEETQYWFELLIEASLVPDAKLRSLMDEADQLTAMLTASAKTSKKRISR